jgi:hypothetical protein
MQGPPFEAGFCFLGVKRSRKLMTRASVIAPGSGSVNMSMLDL